MGNLFDMGFHECMVRIFALMIRGPQYENILKNEKDALRKIFPVKLDAALFGRIFVDGRHDIVEHEYQIFRIGLDDASKAQCLTASLQVIKGAKSFKNRDDIYDKWIIR